MPQTYTNAPITEAIIDFRVTVSDDCTLAHLANIHDKVRAHYPVMEPIQISSATVEIQAQSEPSVSSTYQHNGYSFRSEDGLYVFQAKLDGFTMNRLAPYESWERFLGEATSCWKEYCSACHPTEVTRVAVRYINKLNLPGEDKDDSVELNHYLKTVPEIGSGFPQLMTNFFMQIQCPQEDISSMLVITEALFPNGPQGMSSILLDLDLSRESIWTIEEQERIWQALEVLRTRKNEVFEASITDAARRLFS